MPDSPSSDASPFAIRLRGKQVPLTPTINVLRALPLIGMKSIGPFVFIDHGGPMDTPVHGIPAHPHAGIEVITYLLQGSNDHRDSFGHSGRVAAGGAQWITSGRGMLHAETPIDDGSGVLELVQLWTRHPTALDDQPPRYQAVQAADIPEAALAGAQVRLIAGELPGITQRKGPVTLAQPALLAHVRLEAGASLTLPLPVGQESGVLILHGAGTIDGDPVSAADVGLLQSSADVTLEAAEGAGMDLMLLGGEPAPRPLIFAGSFVFNSAEAAERAKRDYFAGAMGVLDGVPAGASPKVR